MMNLDLNNPEQFTLAGVKTLIASKSDSRTWQLRVTQEGIAYLSNKDGAEFIDGLAFRLESWDEGNGYVGEKASCDDEWVQRVFDCLASNWPEPSCSYIDDY